MYAIEVQDLNFGYSKEVQILKNVNVNIPENKLICVVGHNGSGKSTFSKLISGLIIPDSGIIRVCDILMNSANTTEILNKLGLVFQNPDTQFICIVPEDDIAFGLENRKVPPPIIKIIVHEIADFFNLKDIMQTDPMLLSGGQKQKVAIASILATNPKIVIFDESTSMLDPKDKQEIQKIMTLLVEQENKTVISITHDMEELLVADEIIVFKDGNIVSQGDNKFILSDIEFLKDCKLNPPFIYDLKHKLQNKNILFPSFKTEDEFIDLLDKLI